MNNLAVALTATGLLAVIFVVGALPIGVSVSTSWADSVSADAVQNTLTCDSHDQDVVIGTTTVSNTLPLTKRFTPPAQQVCVDTDEPYQFNQVMYNGSRPGLLNAVPGTTSYQVTVDLSCRGPRIGQGSVNETPDELIVTNSDRCDGAEPLATIPVRD
mgnify:CR=1 FL=1